MTISMKTACITAVMLAGSTVLASAQGGMTDSRGNSMGSERVGNTGAITGGTVRQGMTTGTGTRRSEQDNPNGSPNTPPISRQGPGGDPSRNNDAPK